jgi:hypothetical protein
MLHEGGGGEERILMGKLTERDHLEGLGVDGRIILKWSLPLSNIHWLL